MRLNVSSGHLTERAVGRGQLTGARLDTWLCWKGQFRRQPGHVGVTGLELSLRRMDLGFALREAVGTAVTKNQGDDERGSTM